MVNKNLEVMLHIFGVHISQKQVITLDFYLILQKIFDLMPKKVNNIISIVLQENVFNSVNPI